MIETAVASGTVEWTLTGPDGAVRGRGRSANLITTAGDEHYIRRGAGVGGSAVSGMRLGTGSTAAAKAGAAASIGAYIAGSAVPLTADSPTVSAVSANAGWRAVYRATWPAGTATSTGIREVVLTNASPLQDSAGTATTTISRALIDDGSGGPILKAADESLTLTWTHTFLGA